MPRCKANSCKRKFIPKYFNQKVCSDECKKEYEAEFEQTSLNEKSDKRKEQEKFYKELRLIHLTDNPNCGVCGEEATEIHHMNGRNGERLNDVKYFLSACRGCHTYIHNNPKEARKEGWLV